jgi:membrane dipeptidase
MRFNRLDEAELAERAGVSREAVAFLYGSEVIDLHLESFIPTRLWGYDLGQRHHPPPFGGRFFGQLDFPRALRGGLTGGMWSVTTNIARRAKGRLELLVANFEHLRRCMEATGGAMRVVRTYAEYQRARREGAHAALLCIQGGNALAGAPDGPAAVPDRLLTRVTLVHLTDSCYGTTSSPLRIRRKQGLTDRGRELVRQLNAERVFVDLAHIDVPGFWDAVQVHDRSQPLLVTHTGVDGVCDMWRNIDDDQIRAVADTGGTIGIIFQADFLKRRGGPRDGRMVIEHMQHIIDVVGDEFVSLGSDYDGLIVPPPDLRDGELGYARLVQYMLERGWRDERIQRILGGNFLRTLQMLRPD